MNGSSFCCTYICKYLKEKKLELTFSNFLTIKKLELDFHTFLTISKTLNAESFIEAWEGKRCLWGFSSAI